MLLQVGDWVACTDSDIITRGQTRLKLERRVMETLSVLARRAGQVVMKDELVTAVWHGRVAVSDHSLALVISQLRRALGDDPRTPRYIETITKRGYRLIAPSHVLQNVPAQIQGWPQSNTDQDGAQESALKSLGRVIANHLFAGRNGN